LDGAPIYFSQITDGLSNTILGGEKHVPLNRQAVGWLDSCTYNADYMASCTRAGGDDKRLAQSIYERSWTFGSYHMDLVQFVFCDGHVRALPKEIDSDTLNLLLVMDDGHPIPAIE
jgi:prepilin-type processing-associated H-X9-DG protein